MAFGASASVAGATAGFTTASPFLLGWQGGTLTSLRFHGDSFPTDYIEPGQRLGHVLLAWRRPNEPWQKFDTATAPPSAREVLEVEHAGCAARYRARDGEGAALELEVRLQPNGNELRWTVRLRNLSSTPIEVGDLALPLPMHTLFKGDGPPTASVLKHSFISGHGSFLFWMRSNSVGPYLLMTPEPSTALEFWDRTRGSKDVPAVFRAYIHSRAEGEAVSAAGGRWRQPHTSLVLQPRGNAGYAFRLRWVDSYSGVQQQLAQQGLLDVQVAPGMTVPTDLFTAVAFRSSNPVRSVHAEHPESTDITLQTSRNGYQHFRVQFRRLGENMLTVRQADGRTTRLEFFATEPLETLIRKRGAFIASHQQRDPARWYQGLLSEWNMDSGVMLSPDNYDRIRGWRVYEVTCDDPGLSKPAYLASKLAEYPDQQQVEALDDYIQHFVWGGLQRTMEETESYGIYGIIDWKQNRDSADPGTKGRQHLWRPYDYPHLIVMYWGMYRVARDFPGIHTRLSSAAYLERSYGTAMALFTVPKRLIDWEAYQTGFYNEVVIPALIEELEAVGESGKAATLRAEWQKKVNYFVTGGPNLFGSEYAFDSTGFESTGAIARYALDHGSAEFTPAQARDFSRTQVSANLFCRGVVEKAYYLYGSDYRADGGDIYTLSYMAQMGGAGVLDHALHDRIDPDATVRLGYASYLSAWALMNTGTVESGFGYWFSGQANDGGAGGGFEPAASGTTWLGQPHHRGSWYYSCEIDLGFCGALRSATTVVADDPVFGQFCFGGVLSAAGETLQILPRDGVRRRLNLRVAGQAIDVEVSGARFARDKAIHWSPVTQRMLLPLEREESSSGTVHLAVRGLPGKLYTLHTEAGEQTVQNDSVLRLPLQLTALAGVIELRGAAGTNPL